MPRRRFPPTSRPSGGPASGVSPARSSNGSAHAWTGSSPSKGQAHTLLSPQLALEGALLRRGAFADVGPLQPADLAFVRLKANGEVLHESILEHDRKAKSAGDLSEEAWARLEKLLLHYRDPQAGYLSRALPFREAEVDGEYDHLARVLEWSAGGPGESDE